MIADKLQYFTTPQYTQRILYTQTLLVVGIKMRSKIIYALLWLITSYGLKIKFSYHHINLWIIKTMLKNLEQSAKTILLNVNRFFFYIFFLPVVYFSNISKYSFQGHSTISTSTVYLIHVQDHHGSR